MGRRTAERSLPTLLASYWLPAALYAALALFLGAQPNLKSPLSFPASDALLHVLAYLGLGLLLTRAARASWGRSAPAMLAALCLGILVGTGDELQRAHLPGRGGAFELVADTVGLGLAPFVLRALSRERGA